MHLIFENILQGIIYSAAKSILMPSHEIMLSSLYIANGRWMTLLRYVVSRLMDGQDTNLIEMFNFKITPWLFTLLLYLYISL